MTYRAPINDMLLALNHGAGLQAAVKAGHYGDFDGDITAAVLEEAGKFASDVLAPLNRIGDENGIKLDGGKVTTAPGWPDAYQRWIAGGWNAVSGPEAFGGQGLPLAINAACTEIWSASNIAFGLCPLLTLSAIEALDAHGSDALKKIYLEKLVSGEWTGTMQLTEPQAGSDVGALRTRAERAADGSYRIKGTKIFITYGDHDMTDNIVHFVLARLPDAPAGTKGISLFLIPKFLVNADGSLGERNDIYASGVEHKLGMHASPTCTMTMGDQGRRDRLPDRRGKSRHALHVHDDEPGPARRRARGRRHRRPRLSAGAGVRAGTPPGPRGRQDRRRLGSDHRASRRQAHADADARADRGGAHHLLRHRGGARHLGARHRRRACAPRLPPAARC